MQTLTSHHLMMHCIWTLIAWVLALQPSLSLWGKIYLIKLFQKFWAFGNIAVFWLLFYRWNFTSNQVKYVAYNTEYDISKYVVALSDSEVFYYSQRNQSGTYSLELIKAEFSDSSFSEAWHTTVQYQTSSDHYGATTSVVDSNTNTLWHSLSLENRVVIANQNISTGVQIGSSYLLSPTDWANTTGTAFSQNVWTVGFEYGGERG